MWALIQPLLKNFSSVYMKCKLKLGNKVELYSVELQFQAIAFFLFADLWHENDVIRHVSKFQFDKTNA